MLHRLYLSPGMFGFGHLASYDYFAHVRRALESRFHEAGHSVILHTVDALPTASVRRRAVTLAELVHRTCGDDGGPIHLLGHSTGGLDARLAASPSARLPIAPEVLSWLPRLRSVTTMNCPHYGTPLAKFFATLNGQRMLYAASVLTFLGLSVGAPSLAYASALVGLMGRGQQVFGLRVGVVDRALESVLRRLDDVRSQEVRDYLDGIKRDQGAILQLTPEAMDLFQAGVEDRPGLVYQSTVSMSPQPSPARWARELTHPVRALSMSLFATLHGFTSRYDPRYPCRAAGDDPGARVEAMLARAGFAGKLTERSNDGVVPLRSQLWGTVVWAGLGDHLDVIGHYRGPSPEAKRHGGEAPRPARAAEEVHADWLTSGSDFGPAHFKAVMDAVAAGMLRATWPHRAAAASGARRG